jgi:hypothetical protein
MALPDWCPKFIGRTDATAAMSQLFDQHKIRLGFTGIAAKGWAFGLLWTRKKRD